MHGTGNGAVFDVAVVDEGDAFVWTDVGDAAYCAVHAEEGEVVLDIEFNAEAVTFCYVDGPTES